MHLINYRYPATLFEAKCTCHTGVGMGLHTACEPITYNVRVLRRTGNCTSDGHNQWVSGWQMLKAGCTPTYADISYPAERK